jgi:hypothetical protein
MYSAFPLPKYNYLWWFNAQQPGSTLPYVNPAADFSTLPFAQRDGNLSYRDLILAVTIAEVASACGDIWGISVPYPRVAGDPVGTLQDLSVDLLGAAYSSPGNVTHVDNQSVPAGSPGSDAVTADEMLYARDLLIYTWLYLATKQFATGILSPPPLLPTSINEAWSLAAGNFSTQTVSQGYPLNVALFKTPDQALADRDNTLAAYVANIRYNIDRVWSFASRLLVLTVSPDTNVSEPEVYQLVSSTPSQRVWASWPLLQGTAGQIIYNPPQGSITWQDEMVGPSTTGVPVTPTFVTPDGGIVQLQYQVPSASDSAFYRQKSARLVVRNWRDNLIYNTIAPENNITAGGLWQPNSALITTPGTLQFSVPCVIPPGPIRIGFLVKPSRILNIFGYQNTAGITCPSVLFPTSATLTAAGSISWSFAAPSGGILLSFSITDLVNPTTSFQVQVSYNANVVYSGAWSFGQVPGTAVMTPPVQLSTSGQPGTVTVTWYGNAGAQLTIEELQVTTVLPVNTPVNYSIGAALGPVNSFTSQFAGIPERMDCVWLDVYNTAQQIVPALTLNWFGSQGICLYIYGFDIRAYQGTTPIQNAYLYERHKRSLLSLALDSVKNSWSQVNNAVSEIRTPDPTYGYVWDSNANQRWLNAISLAEVRLFQAFQAAGPGDLGRPALVPAGLVPTSDGTGTILATYATPLLTPALRVCQPWMIDFGCLVAGPDFWPTVTRAAAQQTGAALISPNFTFTVTNPATGGVSITNLTSTGSSVGTGSIVNLPQQAGAFTSYNLLNTGPGGGYNIQFITLTVWMNNLLANNTYTVTVNLMTTTVPGGVVTYTLTQTQVFATSSTMSQILPVVTAAAGTMVNVLSVSIQ